MPKATAPCLVILVLFLMPMLLSLLQLNLTLLPPSPLLPNLTTQVPVPDSYSDLPADLAEYLASNTWSSSEVPGLPGVPGVVGESGWSSGEVPRSNSVPADMAYHGLHGLPQDFMNH